jgi:hypothetical protein
MVPFGDASDDDDDDDDTGMNTSLLSTVGAAALSKGLAATLCARPATKT